MRRRSFLLRAGLTGAAAVLLAAAPVAPAVADDGGFTIEDPRITESSGLAASRQHPGVYWTHNDQDEGAFLYAVDSRTGRTVATITMTGVGAPRDVEAIAMGPDNQLYVGDIGDNDGVVWDHVWVYRLPEPKELRDQSIRATQYVVKYEDGSRDAESMVVHPKTGRVYIIDKHEEGGHLYAGPEKLSPTGTNVFAPVQPVDMWATDAAFSPDGTRLAVRGYFGGVLYDWNGGKIKRLQRLSVPIQRQGESLTYTTDGKKIMFGTEGGSSEVVARDAPGSGSGSSSGSGGSDSASGGGDGDGPGLKTGAVVVIGGFVVLWGLKRVFRRS